MRFRQLILAFLVLLISWDCSDSHVNQVSDEHRELDQSRHRHLTASTANMRREDVDRWRKKKSNKKNRATSLARIAKRMKMLSELNENTKQKLESTPNAFPSSEVKVVSPVLFYENFEINKQAIAMTDKEGNNTRRCSFLAAECEMEVIEHSLVNRFFAPEDQVLELGGRFGTTSCAIAAKQKNSGKLVVVEPDFNVWYLLEANRKSHQCNFWTFRGIVSQQPMFVNEASYATRTTPKPVKSIHTVDNNQTTAPIQIENMNLQDLQQKTGLTFTALLLDCEGCINAVFGNKVDTNSLRSTLSNVRTIILEGDMSDRDPMCTSFCVDYGSWRDKLAEIGFRIVYEEQDQKFASIIHYVFQRD